MCTAPATRKAAAGHAARPEALCTAPATQKAAARASGPEDLPVTKRIDVMVGMTRSKVIFL